jgi:hypothetical protein
VLGNIFGTGGLDPAELEESFMGDFQGLETTDTGGISL